MTPPRTYVDYLADMLGAIDDIAVFVQGLDEAAFGADRKTVYAVTRALEIIGEAAKRVPAEVQSRYPELPWRDLPPARGRIAEALDQERGAGAQ